MTHEAVTQSLSEYARSVRLDRRANPSVAGDGTALELLMAPKFQALIETLLAQLLPLAPRVLPEYRREASDGLIWLLLARPNRRVPSSN
jgi:hypothetical protein